MAHSYQHSTNSNVSGSGPQVLQQQPCNAFGPKGLEKEGVLLTVVRNLLLALLPMAGCLFPVDQPLRSAKRNEIITVITVHLYYFYPMRLMADHFLPDEVGPPVIPILFLAQHLLFRPSTVSPWD